MLPSFVAIDFETANRNPSSACAVGLVRVDRNVPTERQYRLVKQPTASWTFSTLHGIRKQDVEYEDCFADVWCRIEPMLVGCAFVAAHFAQFDARVLRASCRAARVSAPRLPYVCTLAIARDFLAITPSDLASVSRRLGIELRHHDALSDAEAAARILLIASERGWEWTARRRSARGRRIPAQ